MTKSPQAKPPQNFSTERRIAKTAAEKATETLREKILVALVGFVLTGVIGTILTTWVQQRGWAWQNRVAKIEKDTENAMATYRSASELINGRWHATYRMTRALERKADGEEWKLVKDAFDAADRDWALRYTNIAREIDFYIDTPFGVEAGEAMTRVWTLSCTDFALRNGPGRSEKEAALFDASSARVVLEVINHCQGRMKDEIDVLIDTRTTATDAQRKALTELSYRRLDHIYRTNDTLRCVIFERALAIRRMVSAESYWGTFFGFGVLTYDIPKTGRGCVS